GTNKKQKKKYCGWKAATNRQVVDSAGVGSWPSDLCGFKVSYGGLPTSLSLFPVFLEVQRPLSYFFEDFGLLSLGFSVFSLFSAAVYSALWLCNNNILV